MRKPKPPCRPVITKEINDHGELGREVFMQIPVLLTKARFQKEEYPKWKNTIYANISGVLPYAKKQSVQIYHSDWNLLPENLAHYPEYKQARTFWKKLYRQLPQDFLDAKDIRIVLDSEMPPEYKYEKGKNEVIHLPGWAAHKIWLRGYFWSPATSPRSKYKYFELRKDKPINIFFDNKRICQKQYRTSG